MFNFLTETTTSTDPTGGLLSMLPMLLIMIGVFYFMIIRPQRKKDKETKKMLDEMKVGDNITTIGGICGKITKLRDEIVTIEVGADKTELVFEKWAIKTVEKPVSDD